MPLSLRATLLAVLPLAALFPAAAGAQRVRGSLVDPSGAPVPRVLVALLDSAGQQRAAGLSAADGSFLVEAPAPGRFRLRAERIGYATVSSPLFTLAAGELREQRLVAAGRAVTLAGLVVTPAARRCAIRAGSGNLTATLWEEARKALNATAFGQAARSNEYEVVRWERETDAQTGAVLSDQRQARRAVADLPFGSIPPEQLSRDGFVQKVAGDSVMYYAPDASVLLSDAFLDDHCFRTITGRDPGRVGLAFSPAGGRRVPEVEGVLWLDRASAALRTLEYHYVNGPPESADRRVGGTVEFAQPEGGPWMVQRWAIRMPVTRLQHAARIPGMISEPPSALAPRLVAIHEAGGEVMATHLRGERRIAPAGAAPAVLRGVAWDSASGRPLAGARVFLSGTSAEAVSDAAGRFLLQAPGAGLYTLGVVPPEALGPLARVVQPRPVNLLEGDTVQAGVGIPPLARVQAVLCPGLRPGEGMLLGSVRGAAADSLVVSASWTQVNRDGGSLAVGQRAAFIRPDAAGFYLLCGLPLNVDLLVSALVPPGGAQPRGEGYTARTRAGARLVASDRVRLEAGRLQRLELAPPPAAP